jgi:hypothetical protein
MTDRAAIRLASQLQNLAAGSMRSFSASAGVEGRLGMRARQGRVVDSTSYLRLCSAIGVDAATGLPAPATHRRAFEIEWWMFGAAFLFGRRRARLGLRAAAKVVGVSAATLSRAEGGQAVSVESYLLIIRFLGVPALSFLSFTGNRYCNTLKSKNSKSGAAAGEALTQGHCSPHNCLAP